MTKPEAIAQAIDSLNSSFGRGDVVAIGNGTYSFQCQYGGVRYRKFKVLRETESSATVSACGHTLTVRLDPLQARAAIFKREFYRLFVELKKDILDDYRASDDPDDNKPGMTVTVATDDLMESWSYQTGDNSYSGACYHKPHWAVVSLYRNSNCRQLAEDAANELLDSIPTN